MFTNYKLKYIKYIFLILLFTNLFVFKVNAENSCEEYLVKTKPQSKNIPSEENRFLSDIDRLKHKLSAYKNEADALNVLDIENFNRIRLHTSKSIHRASEDFPRIIYLDESDPLQTLVYAFSTRPNEPPILEIQSFNSSGETNLYKIDWTSPKEPQLTQNPRQCFACHSGGRPLLAGLSTKNHWPFVYPEDQENIQFLKSRLSTINNSIQLERLKKVNPDEDWLALINSALLDNDTVFHKKLKKFKSKNKVPPEQIYDFYFEQRDIFLSFMGYKKDSSFPVFDNHDLRIIKLIQAFQAIDLHGFLDLLSLNVRPRNYELDSNTIEDLKQWVSDFNPRD